MNSKTNQPDHLASTTDQAVGIDYFLYSCFEFESTSKALPNSMVGEDRWPVMLNLMEGEREPVDSNDLEALVFQMISWYSEKFPCLTSTYPINFKTLSEIVPPLVMISKDFELLVKEKTGGTIPAFNNNDKGPIWKLIEKTIQTNFSKHAFYFGRYLRWVHAQENDTEVDIGNRPPVGKYAPSQRTRGNQKSYGGSRKPFSANKQGNSRGNYKSPGQQNRHSKTDRPRNRPASTEEARPRERRRERDPRLEQESIKQVIKAVQVLNENPDLSEFRLPAANSYYRRLQHKQAKEEGLFSSSQGEGNERSVVLSRTQQEPID